jgi:hypothetical protein
MDLKRIGCDGVDWVYHAHASDRAPTVVTTVMNLRDP